MSEQIATAEPAAAVLPTAGMAGNRAGQTKLTEPPATKIQMTLLTQPALRADANAIADEQHPDDLFWIDRRVSLVAVIRGEESSDLAQVKK